MGWAYFALPAEVCKELRQLIDERIPMEIRCDNKGKRKQNDEVIHQSFHSTFLLKLNKKRQVEALMKVLENERPVKAQLGELFFSKVERITGSETYAVGMTVESEQLLQLRQQCAKATKALVGYDGFHISLVYIIGTEQAKEIANEFIIQYKHKFKGCQIYFDKLNVTLSESSENQIINIPSL